MAYPNCMFDVEEERFFGIEHKNASMLWYRQQNFNNGCKATPRCPDCPKGCYPYDTVSANQSTVARMAAALSSLATTNATGGWGGFLLKTPDLYGNRVTWNDTIIAGHSRGSAYPLHIGYYWKPTRLVFFCGLEDYQGTRGSGTIRPPLDKWEGKRGLSTPAPWVQGYQARAKALSLVPPEDMFGIGPFVRPRALSVCTPFIYTLREACNSLLFPNSILTRCSILMCWMHSCAHACTASQKKPTTQTHTRTRTHTRTHAHAHTHTHTHPHAHTHARTHAQGGSCCQNWQATWAALGIPGQAFADDKTGRLLPNIPAAFNGAHRIYLRGEHQGHGTPVINCNALGPGDPFNTGCCAFCGGNGRASCAVGNCTNNGKGVKCECAATDDAGAATLAPVWRYLVTSKVAAGSQLPPALQMHCCGSTTGGERCCEDPENLTSVKQCSHV